MTSNGVCQGSAVPIDATTKPLPLSPVQTSVYNTLQKIVEEGTPRVILIDAPSGTGKTHILLTLAKSYNNGEVHFAVFRRDQASQISLHHVSAYTYISYNMRNFSLNYRQALCMFTVKNLNTTDVLFKLIVFAHKYVHVAKSVKVIILDACTIVNPLMLLLLYIVSLKNEITLIFSGNKMQLGSINKSPQLHSSSNFVVLELFSDFTVTELTKNLRTDDKGFLKKITRFGNAIASYKTKRQIPFHFNLRYLLYTLFREKFDPRIPERFDALFMAPFHQLLTDRLYRMMAASVMEPTIFRVEPFNMVPMNLKGKKKFFPGLILVKGFKYIHVSETGVNSVVVLEDMVVDGMTGELVELQVRFKDGKSKRIQKCILNFYQMLPAYRNWLMDNMVGSRSRDIINFPLKPFTTTYYAALGRTISDPVELCTSSNDATSVYVGLCSLPSESNILKFHAEYDFPSFVATDIMAAVDKQEFYYRYPIDNDTPNILEHFGDQKGEEYLKSFLMGVDWVTVDNINNFENNKRAFLRIKRSVYEKNKEVDTIPDSPLMEMTKFVKDNNNVIMDVIKSLRLEKADLLNLMNDTKRKEFREVKTYKILSEAYETWRGKQKLAGKK